MGSGIALTAIVVALLTVTPSPAASCTDGVVYKVCGDHVRRSDLPLRFRVNMTGRPAGVSSAEVSSAVRDAAATWDRAWPFDAAGNGSSSGGVPGDCSHVSTRAICYEGTTGAIFRGEPDRINSIVFDDPRLCPGGTATATATACIFYKGSSSAGRRIAEVDIIVNPAKPWRWPNSPAELVAGELNSLYPISVSRDDVPPIFKDSWYDLQSVLTHELGHALGLEHIGSDPPFPVTLAMGGEPLKYRQSMYWAAYYRSTGPRTLDVGDIAGLMEVAIDSQNDDDS